MPSMSKKPPKHSAGCVCDVCGRNYPFDLPEDLYERFAHGEVVLFAGSGVSTESRSVFPYTLYEDVCGELRLSPDEAPPFPDLMSLYCAQADGRVKLLRKIRERFDYIRSYRELYHAATDFHTELSTLSVVQDIVTTNWDPYFEDECGATPFVTAEDFAFWNVPGRKVLKIHGSVRNLGSLVVTREDYNLCQERLSDGLLGSTLRMILGTKTVVYIGFSFSDEDFINLQGALTAEMKGLAPLSYIVTLDKASDKRFRERGLVPIYTDATYFISVLKRRFVSDQQLLDDQRFEGVRPFQEKVRRAHLDLSDVDAEKFPDVVFGLSYQDGMLHALGRMLALKKTGYYNHACNTREMIKFYLDRIGPEKLKRGKFHDVAYVEGYVDGLTFLLADDNVRAQCPMYFVFGEDRAIRTLIAYRRALKAAPTASPREHKYAVGLVKKSPGLVMHHTPFLL